jgi:hypothetical protein
MCRMGGGLVNVSFDAVYSLFKGLLQTGVIVLSPGKYVGYFDVDFS